MKPTRSEVALTKLLDRLEAAKAAGDADQVPRLRKQAIDKLEVVQRETAEFEARRRAYWQTRATASLDKLRKVAGPLLDEIATCRRNSVGLVPHSNPVQILREALLSTPWATTDIDGDMPAHEKNTDLVDRAEKLLWSSI